MPPSQGQRYTASGELFLRSSYYTSATFAAAFVALAGARRIDVSGVIVTMPSPHPDAPIPTPQTLSQPIRREAIAALVEAGVPFLDAEIQVDLALGTCAAEDNVIPIKAAAPTLVAALAA